MKDSTISCPVQWQCCYDWGHSHTLHMLMITHSNTVLPKTILNHKLNTSHSSTMKFFICYILHTYAIQFTTKQLVGPRIKWTLGCTLSIWSSSHMRLHLLISVVAHTSEALYTYSCVILPLCHKYSHCHEYCNKQLVNCLCHSRRACLSIISWHILLSCAHTVVNWPWELCSFDNFEGLQRQGSKETP